MKQLNKILFSLIILLIHPQFETSSQSIWAPRYNPSDNQNTGRKDSIEDDTSFFEIPNTGAWYEFDELPLFPGGEKALISYILENTVYPKTAVHDSISGLAVTIFSIDVDGSTGDFRTMKSVREDIDNECIRVIKEMPLWKPGTALRRAEKGYYIAKVKWWYRIGMRFSLSNEDKSGIIIKPKPDSSYFHRWY